MMGNINRMTCLSGTAMVDDDDGDYVYYDDHKKECDRIRGANNEGLSIYLIWLAPPEYSSQIRPNPVGWVHAASAAQAVREFRTLTSSPHSTAAQLYVTRLPLPTEVRE